jgi:RimJ/RimL family protein N-acetyltransferase
MPAETSSISGSLPSGPSEIGTARLRLAPLVPADAEALWHVTKDPRIIDAISFLQHPFTLADARTLIALNQNDCDLFRGIWRRKDSVLVGVIGSHFRASGAVEIGYWIGMRFQGQSYAYEAGHGVVEWLRKANPTAPMIAECRPENRASWRVLERLGFRPTGAPGTRPGRIELALPTAA